MSDFLVGVAVAFLVLAGLGIAGYFILRRVFERAAHRVADEMGTMLGDIVGRTAATAAGRRAAARAATSGGRLTNLGAYAAAHGISEDQARREFADSVERLARLMDGAVKVPVVGPVGLDPLLGLFPVAGDIVSAMIAVSLIGRSIKYGVPPDLIARMLGNVVFDLVAGAVPVVGDVADMWFRANLRNVALLREFLAADAGDTFEVTAERIS